MQLFVVLPWSRLFLCTEEDPALSTLQMYVQYIVAELSSMISARHRIVPQGSVLACSQRHLCLDVVVGKVGDEVMMSKWVVASYQFQSVQTSHQFWGGSLCHSRSVVAFDNLGSLRLQLRDVLYHITGHNIIARDDESLISRTRSCFYHTILISTRA